MKKRMMKKRILAIVIAVLMCLQPMLVSAADTMNLNGLKAKQLDMVTETVKETKMIVHIPKEAYYHGKNTFGYDAYAPNDTLEGVQVFVNGVALKEGADTSTAQAVLEKGVQLVLEKGYSLKQYRLVCGEKYSCKVIEETAELHKAGEVANTAAQTTTGKREAIVTAVKETAVKGKTVKVPDIKANEKRELFLTFDKKAFGHAEKETTYWLLLDIEKEAKAVEVKTGEGKTAEVKNAEEKAAEGKAAEAKAAEGKTAEGKAAEAKAAEAKAAEAKAAEAKAAEGKTAEAKVSEATAAETKTVEGKAAEPKTVAAENKSTENETIENKETAEKQEENSGQEERLSPYPSENPTPTPTPEVIPTREFAVSILWEDADDKDGIRPTEVKFQLYADNRAQGEELVLNPENGWKYTIKDLPVKANVSDEKEISYTIKTASVPTGYTEAIEATASEAKITYNHTLEMTDVTVQNIWDDEDDQDGKRPSEIKVQLYADGKAIGDETALSAKNSWKHTFAGLDKNAAGKAVAYTIKVVSVPNGYAAAYTTAQDGVLVVTNKHEVEKADIPVKITFSDSNNQDGIRPSSAEIQLYANSKAVGSAVKLTSAGEWKYTFEDYDVYEAGKKITYTVKAINVAKGYTSSVKNTKGEWIVTQSHTPEKISKTIEIKWDDDDNKTKERPSEVKIQLYANGAKQGNAVTVKSSASWKYTYNNLAKYKDGKEITYTVKQVNPSSKYKEYVKGTVITNVIATKVAAKTADHADFAIWIGIMAVSIFCIGEIYFYKKRRKMF